MLPPAAHPALDPTQLRLVECWLPLLQALAEEEQWPEQGAALEALILQAAAPLRMASDPAAARAILIQCRLRSRGQV